MTTSLVLNSIVESSGKANRRLPLSWVNSPVRTLSGSIAWSSPHRYTVVLSYVGVVSVPLDFLSALAAVAMAAVSNFPTAPRLPSGGCPAATSA